MMFRQRQTIFDGKRGDCFRTCIANALELPLEDLPNFCDSEDWWQRTQTFLRGLNLFFCEIECAEGQTMPTVPPLADKSLCLGAGIGPRGVRHAVLCRYRCNTEKREHWLELEHDPHPSDCGIEKVDIVGWLMVIDPSKPTGKCATKQEEQMKWTTDKPTTDDTWWWMQDDDNVAQIVHVQYTAWNPKPGQIRELCACFTLYEGSELLDELDNAKWAGPIPEPEDA